MSLAVGVRLGPYEVVGALGAGGMGEVYRARDTRIGREVAVKVLPASYADDADRLRRFEQEARTVGALNHPNLLVLFDVGSHEGAPYLVSELLEGSTLRRALGHAPLGVRKAIAYGAQVARGLAAAHEKGIVHRDLKPENLFVTEDGRVKILDFGLARVTRASQEAGASLETATSPTDPGVLLGTLGYMSPEQVRGQAADHRADIFAFGAVLYEMLSGRRAFSGETAADTLTAILHKEPAELAKPGQEFPASLDRILRRCLEKNAAVRFQSAQDLAFALEALSGTSISAPVLSPVPRWRRSLATPALAVGLLAAAALGLLVGRRSAPRSAPSFQRLSFSRGGVWSAQFSPDGNTIVYAATWEGGGHLLYSARLDGRGATRLDLPPAGIHSISPSGEMAIVSGTTLARVPMAGGGRRDVLTDVHAADWAPDGRELAVVRQVGREQRIEFPIGRVLYVTSEGWIRHVRVSPRGDRLAFSIVRRGEGLSVQTLDLAGNRRVLSKDWIAGEGDLAWAPSGDEVWFTASRQSWFIPLNSVDLSGRERVVLTLPLYARLADIAPDGRVLLVLGTRRGEAIGRAPGQGAERSLSWFESTRLRDLSPDGSTIVFDERAEGTGEPALYVRKTDGSPAVRIGEGASGAFSPDARWVVATRGTAPVDQLTLLPTAAGEPRTLKAAGLEYFWAEYFPDGQRLLVAAREEGHAMRSWVQDLEGGRPRPLTPEGVVCDATSPDGRSAACADSSGEAFAFPVDGGEAQRIAALSTADEEEEGILQWSADGSSWFLLRGAYPGHSIVRLDIRTGRRTPWQELRPADPTGTLFYQTEARITRDGRSYAASYVRELSDLYLVDGVR